MGRLDGKTAIVTGGAGGIGRETARLFCREGARVAIVDLSEAAIEEAAADITTEQADAEVFPVAADISDEADLDRVVAAVVAHFGGITTLVNNAGIREYRPLAEADSRSWERIISVNLLGTALCSRAVLPALRMAEGASIVNVASIYAAVGRKGMGQYDATKAGIVSMTRTLAWEENVHGVRVNAVCPGAILTRYHIDRYREQGMSEEILHDKQKDVSLMGRWGDVGEIAYPILWLASDEASFMTGSVLMVDGGVSAM